MAINKLALQEAASLTPHALVELFVLDSTVLGGPVMRFHAGVYPPGSPQAYTDIQWQGVVFNAFPVAVEGFEFVTSGSQPRPKITISNVTGAMTALVLGYSDLCGAKLTRKRTFAQYLDFMPQANPNIFLPDDIWFIEQKQSEDKTQVTFQLATSLDVEGVLLPRRQVIADVCPWLYRGDGCGFVSGFAIADINDNPYTIPGQIGYGLWNATTTYPFHAVVIIRTALTDFYYLSNGAGNVNLYPPDNPLWWLPDECSRTLRGCKLRFAPGPLAFGGFPGT